MKQVLLLPKYELEVWTPDGEYNQFFQDLQEAKKEYNLAVAEFGKECVTLHDFTK